MTGCRLASRTPLQLFVSPMGVNINYKITNIFLCMGGVYSRKNLRKNSIWSHHTGKQTSVHFCSGYSWCCFQNVFFVCSQNEFSCVLKKRVLTKRIFLFACETSAHETSFFCLLTKQVLTKQVLLCAHETRDHETRANRTSFFVCSRNECSRNEFELVNAEHWQII